MHRLQEMLRLYRLGRGSRAIARQLRMGRDTIRSDLDLLAKAGQLEGSADELPALDELRAILCQHIASGLPPKPSSSVERWKEEIQALWEKDADPTAIHDWLRLHGSEYSGSLSAIKRMCVQLSRERGPKATDVAIPVDTAAGEIAQVEFAYAGLRYDPELGVMRKSWLFMMTLGFSRHMFLELVFDQKIATWIRLHVLAFEYFGGVPCAILPLAHLRAVADRTHKRPVGLDALLGAHALVPQVHRATSSLVARSLINRAVFPLNRSCDQTPGGPPARPSTKSTALISPCGGIRTLQVGLGYPNNKDTRSIRNIK